jgi:cobalt-zinc-cadmium efflux system outer membrane protein
MLNCRIRHLITSLTTATFVALVSVLVGHAQQMPANDGVEALVRFGLENNPKLKAQRKELKGAEERVRQAGLLPNPMFGARSESDRAGMESAWMVEASIPLELNGRRGARARLAKADLSVARANLFAEEVELGFQIRLVYGRAVTAKLKAAVLESMLSDARDALKLSLESVERGSLAPLDASMQSVEVARLEAEAERAKTAALSELFELQLAIGSDTLPAVGPAMLMPLNDASALTAEDLVRVALERNPDVIIARAAEASMKARVGLAKAEGRPETEFMVGYERRRSDLGLRLPDGGMSGPAMDRDMRMFNFGLRISVPVFNRNQGEAAAVAAEAGGAADRVKFAEAKVGRDVATAVTKVSSAKRVVEVMGSAVRDRAQRNLSVLRESQRFGGRSIGDILGEQRRVLELEREYLDAVFELYNASLELLRAMGSERLIRQ